MKESQKPVTRELWYQGQKAQSDRIKRIEQGVLRLIKLMEDFIDGRTEQP